VKKQTVSKLNRLKKNIITSLNYSSFFKSENTTLTYFTDKFHLHITDKNKRYASGYIANTDYILFLKGFKFKIDSNKLIIRPRFINNISNIKNIKEIVFYFKNENFIKKAALSPINFSYYFFIMFVLIPFAVLFNNKNWFLKTVVFFSMTFPLFLLLISYLKLL
jgi:hypothetical protein